MNEKLEKQLTKFLWHAHVWRTVTYVLMTIVLLGTFVGVLL